MLENLFYRHMEHVPTYSNMFQHVPLPHFTTATPFPWNFKKRHQSNRRTPREQTGRVMNSTLPTHGPGDGRSSAICQCLGSPWVARRGTSIPTVLIQELVVLKSWKTGIKIHQDLLSISTGILHTTYFLIYPSTISESHWAQWFWRDIMLLVNHHRMYSSWLKVSR